MNFYDLKIEPLVRSSYPVHERFRNDLEPLLVVITVEGLERVDWEVRPEKLCWILSAPEMICLNSRKYHYQVGFRWEYRDGTWFYTGCPIRNLHGYWIDVDGITRLAPVSENERPIVGRQAASIHSDTKGVHYSIRAKNTSGQGWHDVFFRLCLNHYQAPITGYRPHFRFEDSWIPFQEIPGVTPHCFFPTQGMLEEYQAASKSTPGIKPERLPDRPLSFPGIVCWNLTEGGDPLLTCHFSKASVAAGANQLWPCTDLLLWFGDIGPGEELSRTGHVLIMRSDLKDFAKHADDIMSSVDSDTSELR